MIIDVCDVHKRYGSTDAVDGIDLAVDRGEILGMLGANGAGKTTLVECIAGLRAPDSGSIRVAGLDPRTDRSELTRSEEHTSELQSRGHLVCRLLLEKKKRTSKNGPMLSTS